VIREEGKSGSIGIHGRESGGSVGIRVNGFDEEEEGSYFQEA